MQIFNIQKLLNRIASDDGCRTEVHAIDIHNNGQAVSVYYGDKKCQLLSLSTAVPTKKGK